MLGLVLRALAARRAQAVWLGVLTALSVSGAAAAPWYHAAAVDLVTHSDIAAAAPNERALLVAGRVNLAAQPAGSSPLPATKAEVTELLDLPDLNVVQGLQSLATAQHGLAKVSTLLAYRENQCDHLIIEGACPRGTGEVVISAPTAAALGIRRGDELAVSSFQQRAQAAAFRVVGIYEPKDLDGTYWVATGLLSSPLTFPAGQSIALYGDAVFTTEQGLIAAGPGFVDTTYQVVLTEPVLADASGGGLSSRLHASEFGLGRKGYAMRTSAGVLADLIARDRRLATIGVGVAAAQVLLLCWFCLFLAVRHTAEERRPDIGMLKLRGAARWRVWALTAQQSALPMLAGAVVGWGLGYLAAVLLVRWNSTAVPLSGGPLLSVAAAVVAALGALAVATAAEWRSLGTPVTGLLRRVPSRRSGWRADAVDLVVVLVAAAGIYQAWTERGVIDSSPLPLLAPALMALALGLLAARALPLVAARMGAASMRSGRPGLALASLHLARRPGTNRVVAMLVVAVALLCTATLTWQSADAAALRRATQELGAARVLTVTASTPDRVLNAVRRADPDGRYAMAAARVPGGTNVGLALAVDATRIERVALWLDDYGISTAEVARLLRPPVPATIAVTDGMLTLQARVPAGVQPAIVTAVVARTDGVRTLVRFGPVTADGAPVRAPLDGCPPASPCRLVGLNVEGPAVELRRLDGPAGAVVDAATFGDVRRWRPAAGLGGLGVNVAATGDRLTITDSPNPLPGTSFVVPDTTVYAVDAPVPLPILVAGGKIAAEPLGDDRISPVGSADVPFRIAGEARVLPQLGAHGGYFDLESAIKAVSFTGRNPTYEVWLTKDAPASLVDSLTGSGLTVLREDSIAAAVTRYGRQGPGTALRFLIFAAGISVLLAAGSLFVVAAVERGPRAAELAALRAQGLAMPALRITGYAGPALLVCASVLVGLLSAVLARSMIQAAMPVFTDGWRVLSIDTGAHAAPLLLAAAVALLALAGATLVAARQTIRMASDPAAGDRT